MKMTLAGIAASVVPRTLYLVAKNESACFHGNRKGGSRWDEVVAAVQGLDSQRAIRLMRRLTHGEAAALRANAIARGVEITIGTAGDHTYVMRRCDGRSER